MIVQLGDFVGAEMVTGSIELAQEAAFHAVVIELDEVGARKIIATGSDFGDVFGSDVAAFQIDQLTRGQVMHSELDQLARVLQVDIHESHLKQPALVDIEESELFHLADERRIRREAETAAAHAGYDAAFANQAAGIALQLEMNVRVERIHVVAREAFQIFDAVVGAFHPGGGDGGTLEGKLDFSASRHPTVQAPGSRGGNSGVGRLRDQNNQNAERDGNWFVDP